MLCCAVLKLGFLRDGLTYGVIVQLIQTIVLGVVVAAVAGWFWRRWRVAQKNAQQKLAMLQFAELQEKLQTEFLAAAGSTGKPRGLRWKNCELHENAIFATDRASNELCCLTGVTVSFEAIEGGGMEDVEAVSNLRSATAIFFFRNHGWTTEGRVIFNLEPEQALERFQETLEAV